MPLKIPIKIHAKKRRCRVKIRYLAIMLAMLASCLPTRLIRQQAAAASCPDVKLIFARGSGEKYNSGESFQALNAAIGNKLQHTSLSYRAVDLPYSAAAVGASSFSDALVTLGAAISGGENFRFGRSVATGVSNLANMINSDRCSNTKFILAGYSQGAMVVDKALSLVDQRRILYVATFGDPKIYLPEGKGLFPAACRGQNLSDYRVHVPDCHAYQGLLGAYNPYRSDAMAGRVGTWCNNHDVFCSSLLNFRDHESYVSNNLYEDASRVIFGKINEAFDLHSSVASNHDTAILIDSTGSMQNMINQYKAEALRLAKETIDSGGRIALYDYRDLNDPYQPVEHCNFENCTLEVFEQELDSIKVQGGGDTKESLLSASLTAMRSLRWKNGATKSLVVLTDAGFHSPDLDNTSLEDVVQTSKKIDPVNFYIITTASMAPQYTELATRTDGKVVTNMNELSLLTDYIMDRYDSLPRVEESDVSLERPSLTIDHIEQLNENTARVRYSSDASKAIVILNDDILGITDQKELTLHGLNFAYENILTLVPLTEEVRGEAVSATINNGISLDDLILTSLTEAGKGSASGLPKAPNSSSLGFRSPWQSFLQSSFSLSF